jgi:FkbM family methyltransferase
VYGPCHQWYGPCHQTKTLVDLRAPLLVGRAQPSPRPGAFRFPFGPVRCMGAGVMLSLYREIFLDCGLEVVGLGDAPVILDCGGNIGMGVIWFKQRYPRARITVFEADPQTADLLEENARALGLTSVTVVRAAVSDAAGKVSFVPEGSLGGHVGDGPEVLVDTVRLSDLITEPVDYLKVEQRIWRAKRPVRHRQNGVGQVSFVRIALQSCCVRPGCGTVDGAFASGLPHHG